MLFDFANKTDIPALKQLWKQVFGDTDSYIDRYFCELYHFIRISVVRDSTGKPVSMLSMIPVSIKAGGRLLQGHYIYGAATLPAAEGQGLMTGLIEFSCKQAAEQGDSFSCLVPASDSLFRFYEKRGYQTVFYRDWYHFPPCGPQQARQTDCFEKLDKYTFAQRRKAFVKKMDFVLLQPDFLYPYLYEELVTGSAEVLSIKAESGSDYLVCDYDTDILMIKETSLPPDKLNAAIPSLKKYFGRDDVMAMLPASGKSGVKKPYGMLRPLREMPAGARFFYMGLMMD